MNKWFARALSGLGGRSRSGPVRDAMGSARHRSALRGEGALQGGGAGAGRLGAEGLCGPGPRVAREGSGLPGDPAPRLRANFAFALGQLEAAGPSPERLRPGAAELIRKRLKPRGPNSTCHREADVERDRERKQAGAQSPGKVLPRLGAIIKM